MMTVWQKLFSFPSLTLGAIAESALAIKLFPEYYSSGGHIGPVALIFLATYGFGAFFWLFVYPNIISPLRHIPGEKSLLSAAHRSLIVKDGPSGDIFLALEKQYPGQDLIRLDMAASQFLVANPRLLADLHVHRCYDFAKPPRISNFLRHILGDGLVVVEGKQHKFLRKNTMPAFHFRHIKNLYPMMWEKAALLTKTLRSEIDRNSDGMEKSAVFELNSWASKVTLDIIAVAGMGRSLNILEKGSDPLNELYEQLLEPSREKLVFSMLSLALGLRYIRMLPWKMNQVFNHLTTSLTTTCQPMVTEKKEAMTKKQDDHFDILSLLIKTNSLTDSELKDQMLTFLAAGHETTASALTWACYLMSKHPEYQQKLRDEVTASFPAGSLNDPPADLANILEQLPLLNGIMHETLRLYPTVPMTMREALCDTYIGEHLIPKGTVMVVSIWLINRSPHIWGPRATDFVPERWITEEGKPNLNGGAESNYDFMTFLHGPRSCIGQGFAKAEIRCLLATMVTSFSWDLAMDDKKVVPRGVITIKPESGMYLRLKALE